MINDVREARVMHDGCMFIRDVNVCIRACLMLNAELRLARAPPNVTIDAGVFAQNGEDVRHLYKCKRY